MSPVQTEAQASPSFSLLLFTPCPSHLIPSPPRARDIRSGRRGSSATNTGSRNACRMQHSYAFELWSRELRLTIPWQILNVLARDHRVGSNAFPSPSTARFGGVTVVLAGDPKQCLPVILKRSPTQIVDFVDAPGGTRKTFLEKAVLARIRSEGTYALAVASSSIVALLLPKGRTAHSRFKVPIIIFDDFTCNVPKQGQFAELSRMCDLIVRDEAPMQHRRCFQLVDTMLQDVRSSTARFGGLTVVLAGDPRLDFMDNSKNTDSCTTSRRSEGQQQHCQWERPERERSEDLGHIKCGDSGKGSQ
ncbi:BQ5605_C003g02086 [Microbotryum silenes-dioicae]|uniref:ATP-dependent DNA helicase n=1 Tax=Microbotryum silenes-dioicae TaxID=796604 RepID=A0A2X0NXZ8_9BASI|nr:BQ5605_C003g02086 [Microbotryum silenes-dioicae]